MTSEQGPSPVVVVTGANGFVGARVCDALVRRGATVRGVVRRPGTARVQEGLEEHVGEFGEAGFAAQVVAGADAVVTTVHPMGSALDVQQRVGVEDTVRLAEAARDAGVARLVHVSTAAVYDRSPGAGDVDEASALVGEDADPYGRTKRDLDLALADVEGITRVLVRPPAILGAGDTSVWNTLQPRRVRDDERERHRVPDATFAWVHVDDLVDLLADVATGRVAARDDVTDGPLEGGCTAVNVAGEPATQRDYLQTVADAVGVEPVWEDGAVWTGRLVTDRARGWGWSARVPLADALGELAQCARALV